MYIQISGKGVFLVENQKTARSALAVILIGVAIVLQIVGFFNPDTLAVGVVLGVLLMLGLGSAILYLLFDARKKAANYYKFFMFTYAAEAVYAVIAALVFASSVTSWGSANMCFVNIVEILGSVCIAVCICLLAFRKNLTKNPSLLVARLNLAVTVVKGVIHCLVVHDFATYYPLFVGTVVMAVVVLIMVRQKYADKDQRGTI